MDTGFCRRELEQSAVREFERRTGPECPMNHTGATRPTMQTTTATAPRSNQLIELYYLPLFRLAASLCRTPEAALALTQRTFRRAFEREAKCAAPVNVSLWLFTMLFLEFLEDWPDCVQET